MSMNEELNSWQEVIVDFFENKANSEVEKYIKEKIKEVDAKFKKEQYFNDLELELFFKKNKPREGQTVLEFQKEKINHILSLCVKPVELNTEEIKLEYQNKCENIAKKYIPNRWLTKNAENAKSVSFATHVVKLTHSKIDSPSFYDSISSKKNTQLTTSSLKNKAVDGAVAGNQFAPIFQFLELELNGKKLAPEFVNTDNTILQPFDETNDREFKSWNNGFNKSLTARKISANSLLKQVYFQINNNDYHLLCNVKSSSMAHIIFENIFSKNEEYARKLRSKSKYSNILVSSFPRKSKLSITVSNHNNASQLNGKRGGKINLFSTQPPTWQSKLKPPTNKKSMFDNYHCSPNTNNNIKYLVEFLLRNESINLSVRAPEKQQWLEKWTAYIIDDFWFFVGNIHNLPSGWSNTKGIKLKVEHKYLLDPYRDDQEFQANRGDVNWQKVVVSDFSTWLNEQLKSKDKKFTPQKEYSRTWKKVMEKELREYNQTIEMSIGMEVKV